MSCGGITFGDYEQEHVIDTCGSSGSSTPRWASVSVAVMG